MQSKIVLLLAQFNHRLAQRPVQLLDLNDLNGRSERIRTSDP